MTKSHKEGVDFLKPQDFYMWVNTTLKVPKTETCYGQQSSYL